MSKSLYAAFVILSAIPNGSLADRMFDEITVYSLIAKVFAGECEKICETPDFTAQRIDELTYVVPPTYRNSTQVDLYKITSTEGYCGSAGCSWSIVAVGTDQAWYTVDGMGQFVVEYYEPIILTPETEMFLPNYLGNRPRVYRSLAESEASIPIAGALESDAIEMAKAISGPLYVWAQSAFDLGRGGSTQQVSGLPSWKMQQALFQQGNAVRDIYQDEALRIAREAEERGTARCDRIRASGGGLCMQLTNTANQLGWHAVFNLTTNAELIDQEDFDTGFSRYSFGRIDTVRVLDTRPSTDDSCDIWVKYRVWPVEEDMTIVGAAFMQANSVESIDQEVCYRLGRNSLNAVFTNTITE